MKRKLLSLLTTSTLAIGLLAVVPANVYADTIEGDAYTSAPTTVYDKDGNTITDPVGSTDVKTKAKTNGTEKKIKYNIEVTFGAMEFEYDYGLAWDPVTHSYKADGTRKVAPGWNENYVDGGNNVIQIRNNSNYPVDITLSHDFLVGGKANTTKSVFNPSLSTSKAVIALFSKDNDKLLAELTNGYGDALNDSTNVKATFTDTLDVDDELAKKQSGAIYAILSTPAAYENEYFFSYCGKPADGTKIDAGTEVGRITVNVAPTAAAVTKKGF